MSDARVPFDEAKRTFREFLRSQGWPDDVLWLVRDRITGHRRTHWVFRATELVGEEGSRSFYESVRCTASSIRIDALGQVDGKTVAYVQDVGGSGRHLNHGVLVSPWPLRPVSSRLLWTLLRLLNHLRGESPFLRGAKMPG